MPDPRVLILFNRPVLPVGHPDHDAEAEVLYSVQVVRESLTNVGIPSDEFGVGEDPTDLIARLTRRDFDVVFNLFEGTGGRSETEVYFTGLLEWLRVPYTGCPSNCLALCRSKPLAKRLLAGAGVRTAEFALFDTADLPPNPVGFPAIVKPAAEDASLGIEQASVVTTDDALRGRVQYVLDNYGPPALVERYIAGREIQVSLVDLKGDGKPTVLPLAEVAFDRPAGVTDWAVYTYTAKWFENSDEYKRAPVVVGVEVPPAVNAELEAAARQAYRVLGGRDYARVDTRITPDGRVYVLEMNPNPSITTTMIDSGLTGIGVQYDQFVATMVRNAAARGAAR